MTEKQNQIVSLWEDFEESEPDISTDRLMEMVSLAAEVDVGEVAAALHAPKGCQHVNVRRLPGVSSRNIKISICLQCGAILEEDRS